MMLPEPQRVLPVILHPEILRMVIASRVRLLHLVGRQYANLSEGDMLWAREALVVPNRQPGGDVVRVIYSSCGNERLVPWPRGIAKPGYGTVPPAGMPLHLSRLTLVVTEMARMRIQQIDEDEAVQAGVSIEARGFNNPLGTAEPVATAHEAFGRMWDAAVQFDHRIGWTVNPEVTQVHVRAIARSVTDLVPGLGSGGVR
jgi:hypothetical protein